MATLSSPTLSYLEQPKIQKLVRDLNNPWKMRFYFFSKLPSLFFWGGRVQSVDPLRAEVRLPYSWWTQNPFRSIYFAAQCGAAELSTGLLALIALHGRPPISMLVIDIQTQFFKKANQTTVFTCEDGPTLHETIEKVLKSDEAHTLTMKSIGRMPDGTVVSETHLTWSFKKK
jgi:hypothetical protein